MMKKNAKLRLSWRSLIVVCLIISILPAWLRVCSSEQTFSATHHLHEWIYQAEQCNPDQYG